MGIAFVLVIWAIVGAVAATIGSLVLAAGTWLLVRRRPFGPFAIALEAALPFLTLGWGGVFFFGQAAVNVVLLGRDPGLGDGFRCPLPNGYSLSMIDMLDSASLTRAEGEPFAMRVQALQLKGDFMAGMSQDRFGDKPGEAFFFLIDARRRTIANFDTRAELAVAAQKRGVVLSLEPVSAIYGRYRPTWFDLLALLVLVIPPLAGLGLLFGLIWWIRR